MFETLIILGVVLAGYTGAPWWLVLLGGAGLTTKGWWVKLTLLRQQPSVAWSTKFTAYFVTGVLSDMCFAALSYGLGCLLAWWVGA
jgi:hypothetical protein